MLRPSGKLAHSGLVGSVPRFPLKDPKNCPKWTYVSLSPQSFYIVAEEAINNDQVTAGHSWLKQS